MSWSKPTSNGMGNLRSERTDRGQCESLHGPSKDGKVDRSNHAHFHKDGVTVTKNGEKNTIFKSNR